MSSDPEVRAASSAVTLRPSGKAPSVGPRPCLTSSRTAKKASMCSTCDLPLPQHKEIFCRSSTS
eukprot:442188-Alexandrium_andersonii.AAC.1